MERKFEVFTRNILSFDLQVTKMHLSVNDSVEKVEAKVINIFLVKIW